MNPNLPTDETMMDGGEMPMMDAAPAMPAEDRVSLQALAMPDESERLETPGVGDRVAYQVEGTISRIEGDQAFVAKDSVNGQPVSPTADDVTPEQVSDADDIEKLTADAQGMSQGGF